MPLQDASIQISNNQIDCVGAWTVEKIGSLSLKNSSLSAKEIKIDGQAIQAFDSAGAWLLNNFLEELSAQNKNVSLQNFNAEYLSLIKLVQEKAHTIRKEWHPAAPKKFNYNFFHIIGKETVTKFFQGLEFITFLGEVCTNIYQVFRRHKPVYWQAFLNVLQEMGLGALPIVALLSFLIGVVLAYQMGQQLKVYGANIYIVSLTGVAVLQEFAPLITAIIVAGRTSSAFTAQIGSMKINEEIDALCTMGISPINRLVIPKVFAMIVALPLVTFWADIFGVLGCMVMSKSTLGVSYYNYLNRFPQVVELSTFFNGLIKTPVFAFIIAIVGCFQGLKVALSADSVGQQTTRSVVQAIFLIIIADAIFSVLLKWQGL